MSNGNHQHSYYVYNYAQTIGYIIISVNILSLTGMRVTFEKKSLKRGKEVPEKSEPHAVGMWGEIWVLCIFRII